MHVASGQLLVGSNTGAGVHVNPTGSIEICRTAGSADPFIDFKDDSTQDYDVRLQMDDGHFKIVNTGGERVRVTSAGNVGIGTTSPSEKLHVVGDVLIDGSANAGTNIALLVGGSGNGQIKTRHIEGKDYQSASNGALYLNYYSTDAVIIAYGGGKVGIGQGSPLARLQVEELGIDTTTTSTTATTQVAIDTFVASHFRSAEFTIQVKNSTDSTYHLTKVLLIHDGTTPAITEYGTIFTGSAAEATFDADISSGNVRLLATPASTDSMTFKVVRHCITV